MRGQVIGIVLLAGIGGVLAWLVVRDMRSEPDVSERASVAKHESAASASAASTSNPVSPPPAASVQRVDAPRVLEQREVARTNGGSGPAPLPQETADVAGPAPKTLVLPEATVPPAADQPESLGELLNSSTIRCDIYAAHGANWSSGKAILHDVMYQGGPFSFQAINVESGTATMTGTSGVTKSPIGELEVRVTPSHSGLSFTGFARTSELIIVTVYAAVDSEGRFPAVMSRHGPNLNYESAQFYGGCETTLTQR